ncbi:Translation initiation factor IF-3 [Cytospora mali]|uniref:Translation initiation factor IF-3 n=1 Tax=Cytospora mali TaxID=578113 RepID=A0A194W500_CYTMA|nr:Translation initiation factor IF-3 [Valsa mali]
MSGKKCVFNPATALRRVFMPTNLGSSDSLHLTRIFVPALLAPPQQVRAYWAGRSPAQDPPRTSSFFNRDNGNGNATRAASAVGNFRARGGRQPPSFRGREEDEVEDDNRPGPRVKSKLGRLPRDDEITWPYVFVKMPAEDGHERLAGPRPVKEVLAELDLRKSSLQAVVMPQPENEDAPQWPICKIVNKKEELARQKELKDRKKQNVVKEKELELNWVLAPHDLDHKLKTMQKFLAKGYKVQVLLLKKRGSKARVAEKDAKALLGRVEAAVAEVTDSKEWKKREGQLLGSLRLFLQGNAQEWPKHVEEVVEEEATE